MDPPSKCNTAIRQYAVVARIDRFRLEQIASDHPVGADLFVPFAILRLGDNSKASSIRLTVELQNIPNIDGAASSEIEIHWSPQSIPSRPIAIDDRSLTEWAACGIACIVVAVYAGLTVREVTANGDRFDYWVFDGENRYGLEVSGMTSGSIKFRHAAKVRQLLDNPFGVDGYVVVVDFAKRHIVFSYHRFDDQES